MMTQHAPDIDTFTHTHIYIQTHTQLSDAELVSPSNCCYLKTEVNLHQKSCNSNQYTVISQEIRVHWWLLCTVGLIFVRFSGGKTLQLSFSITFSNFMAQQELSKLFWLHFHITLIAKGRAINTIALSILVIISEIVIISPLTSYLFLGPMEGEKGCKLRWLQCHKMQIKMF